MKTIMFSLLILSMVSCKQLTGANSGGEGSDGTEACGVADAGINGYDTSHAESAEGIKSGGDDSQCAVSTCLANYTLNATTKACEPTLCTLANSVGRGVNAILNVATVQGTFLTGCTAATCSAAALHTDGCY